MDVKDFLAALNRGHAVLDAEHAAGEVAKRGHFRGGNVGLALENGKLYGKCARLSYLRSIGLEPPLRDPSVRNLFMTGVKSEEILQTLLEKGLEPGYRYVTGDPIAFKYQLADGTTVSGRPDGAVVDAAGKVVRGLEFKLAASIWTALSVLFDLRPKSDALVQAAHYSANMGFVPFFLVYSTRTEFHLSTAPKWLQDKFAPGHPFVTYKDDGVTPLKIKTVDIVYDLQWNAAGRLTYWTEGLPEPRVTQITAARIAAYYERVARLRDTGEMPPRPAKLSVDGSKGYDACSYCDLRPVCDEHEDSGGAVWEDMVRLQVGDTSKSGV